jgi:hypothetical protein
MDPALTSFLFGVAGAFFGQIPHIATQLFGVLTSFSWLGYLVYVAIDRSIGTAGLAFMSGVGGAVVGTGASLIAIVPAIAFISRRNEREG